MLIESVSVDSYYEVFSWSFETMIFNNDLDKHAARKGSLGKSSYTNLWPMPDISLRAQSVPMGTFSSVDSVDLQGWAFTIS